MTFMIDTDISSYFMRGGYPNVDWKMKSLGRDDVCISIITKYELLFGVEISQRREKQAVEVDLYLHDMQVLDLPLEAGQQYARIRAGLQHSGRLIGSNDMLIAAHAMHLGVTLVTNNVREFSRVPGLKIENWADEG